MRGIKRKGKLAWSNGIQQKFINENRKKDWVDEIRVAERAEIEMNSLKSA